MLSIIRVHHFNYFKDNTRKNGSQSNLATVFYFRERGKYVRKRKSNSESTGDRQQATEGIGRRDVLLGMGTAVTMAYAGFSSMAMIGHDHSKHSTRFTGLIDAVNACNDKDRRCVSHCMVIVLQNNILLFCMKVSALSRPRYNCYVSTIIYSKWSYKCLFFLTIDIFRV